MKNTTNFNQNFFDNYETLSDEELMMVEGGRNKLAYEMGHYYGKAEMFKLAVGGLVIAALAL